MNLSLQNQWDNIRLKLELLWTEKLAPRYDTLQESEQRTVKIAAITLPLVLVIFGIVLPILDTNKALQHDVAQLATQVAEANQLANILASKPATQKNVSSNNILSSVDKLARQAGVRSYMTRLRPQQIMGAEQRLQTQIKSVPYQKLTDFILTLEKNGYNISKLKIQAAGTGLVHMQASIGR
ncbi:MAG: type II secretion system protein GspM [Ghiorsea sp.]|nr:type II secretion system protein GspM [Ghiorsea sp.]MDQ6979963.1 type II secretion system protein GspM [Ghiorsea sp.]MDQ7058127.1 type II secretion system protein GspM [Ghiorsea sp.]